MAALRKEFAHDRWRAKSRLKLHRKNWTNLTEWSRAYTISLRVSPKGSREIVLFPLLVLLHFLVLLIRLRWGWGLGGLREGWPKARWINPLWFILLRVFLKLEILYGTLGLQICEKQSWVTSCLKFIIYKLLLYLISHITFFYCIFTLKTKNKLWLSYIISIYKLEKAPW